MTKEIARREFLKSAPLAAALVYAGAGLPEVASAATPIMSPAEPANAESASSSAASIRIGSAPYTPIADYPIQPKRYSEVTLTDAFWKPKVETNASVTIPFEVQKLSGGGGGRGLSGGVLEGAILSLPVHPDPVLQPEIDARVESMSRPPADPLRAGNSGFEIAATYYAVTGKRDLLENATKTAAALYQDFQVRNPPFSGGERDAINCVQLYRATHDKKHLDLAKHYLDIRGLPNSVGRSRHNQSYEPVLEQREAVGHAVNCTSLMVSLVDVGTLTGLPAYFTAGHAMWQDAVDHKMYITGGVGSSGNEGFGTPYWLPNISAYSETCAVMMFITLNHHLFMATGDSKYIDVMERGMYNNALDGVAAAGNRFFYVNRLASAGDGRDERWEHASLECCPPNLVRFMAHMADFIYARDKGGAIYVNLYVSNSAEFAVGHGTLGLAMDSDMPWGGTSRIKVSAKENTLATLKLRIPGWTRNQPAPGGLYSYAEASDQRATISVNGKKVLAVPSPLGYVAIDRTWHDGDVVEVSFPMETRRVVANAKVKEDRRRMAIERGPIVYCAEWPDLGGKSALELLVDPKAELRPVVDSSVFGGATVLETVATTTSHPDATPTPVRLIPYHLWANRGAGEMAVWLSTSEYVLGDVGPAGGTIFYVNPNAAKDGWRYLEAAPFDQSAGAKWGCFRQLIPGAKGTAVGTGKQNTADMIAACADHGTAADLAASLSINGVKGWFLPSRDELALMYKNLRATKLVDFGDSGASDNFTYWTSSQQTADMAGHIDFADLGRQHGDDKDFPRRVRAIRAI